MPGYKYGGKPLVYFACAKKHIGFYPTPTPIKHFSPQLKDYKTSKGAIQFPHTKKLPWELMKKLIQFRL